MSATPTPRPWTVEDRDRHGQVTIAGADGWLVAVVPHGCLASGEVTMEANAALIVRAVNLHDELLAALRLIESVYRQNCVAVGEPSSVLDALQAVLARADASQEAQTKE